jgi:hypothetical protein
MCRALARVLDKYQEQYPEFRRTDYPCIMASQYEDLIRPTHADTFLSDTPTQTL